MEAEMPKNFDPAKVKSHDRPAGMPFAISKIGHLVLHCRDIERTVQFYTQVLGFRVSDIYPHEMVPGCMEGDSEHIELNHVAFEVATLDEIFRARIYLEKMGVPIDFEGRRRAGTQ